MRRVFSLPSLVVVVWVSCLAFMGLLAGMLIAFAWNPHFLPATASLALVILTGSALIVGASWRIIRGPDRRRALACLLVGAAPLWFLAGFFLYGLEIVTGRNLPMNVAIRLLAPLAQSLLDLDARFEYPQRTIGEKVVMISAPMPEAEARAQVAAMDRHVGALEARLNRKIPGGYTGYAGRCSASGIAPSSACAWGPGRETNRPTPKACARPTATKSPTACSPASAPRGSPRPPC